MNFNGVELPDADVKEISLGVVVLAKVMNAEGEIRYREWISPALHPIEALGMTTTFEDTLRAVIMHGTRGRPA